MKDWTMYGDIQALKAKGFKKNKARKKLKISYHTIAKYWDMTPKEFEDACKQAATRPKRIDSYRQVIVEWLTENNDMSSAQIYDWLAERYGAPLPFSERTLRLYVREIREQEGIPKTTPQRQYEAVDDPPMGFQAQVDMGETKLMNSDGKKVKIYCFAMVLSHSRHKYVRWQEKPFTATSFIDCHERAFAFFGGQPKEIVYDQDNVLAVSENYGDIIYTEVFQTYLAVKRFLVYLCRGNDPESKGRIEAVVKYAKNNFAKHRILHDIDSFNEDCIGWLERTGNGKKHQITHKIPAEVFALEREHLTPVSRYDTAVSDTSVYYQVRKDNTVMFRGNRYCVPKGTYSPGIQVKLKITETSLTITDPDSKIIFAKHNLAQGKGKLIKMNHVERELNKTLTELLIIIRSHFADVEPINTFIEQIRNRKPRYIKDQMSLMRMVCEHPELSSYTKVALEHCIKNYLYSASDFRAAAEYYCELSKAPIRASPKPIISGKYPKANPKVRDLNEYRKAMEG